MYAEADFLPLSGLQHMVYCDRQAALIHVDRVWADNALTVEGTNLHRVVDEGGGTVRDRVRTVRGIALRSARLGLVGRADAVELHGDDDESGAGFPLARAYQWRLLPVEYKRGSPKPHRADEVQLCAQAMCLEEMFFAAISVGHLYYGQERRRSEVEFDAELRSLTAETARAFHDLVESRCVPVRPRESKCDRCSLVDLCMPPPRTSPESARQFLDDRIQTQHLRRR